MPSPSVARTASAAPPPRRWRRHAFTLACASALGASLALGLSPAFVEHTYAHAWSPALCTAISHLTALVPISLADVLLVALPVWLLGRLARGAWRIARGRARLLPTLGAGVHCLLRWALAIAAAFYLIWGLNYQRRALPVRLAWPEARAPADRNAQADEIESLCRAAAAAANAAYREALGTDDVGTPSSWPGTRGELEAALDAGMAAAARELGLEPAFLRPRGASKRPLLAPLMTRLHISGFFFPWTSEANVNGDVPACDLVHVTAHEKSHQRGIAREDEAEFIGFLAAARAPHPYARYSAHLMACDSLLRELSKIAGQRAQATIDALLPGIQRDRRAVREFWDRHKGRLTTISITINDTYLRAHGDVRGVLAYGAVADLLVRYARQSGGRLDVPRAPPSR